MKEEKKYELVKEDSIKYGNNTLLYRIKALKDFGDVKKGDIGGYIESEYHMKEIVGYSMMLRYIEMLKYMMMP